MANKVPNRGFHHAIGYWGGEGPWRRVNADQSPAKVRALLQDKLITRGKWAYLYMPVSSNTAGVVACTCVKDTTTSADKACQSCFGTHFAPGYLRFHHTTYFACSAQAADFTLVNTELVTLIKPHRIFLVDGATSGTIETEDVAFTNPNDANWETDLRGYVRETGSTVTAEFSTDLGVSWDPIADINDTLVKPTGSGTIRFRVTMTRASANDLPPAFEIIRIRRPNPESRNRRLVFARPDYVAGKILVLRTWVQEANLLEAARGRLLEHQGDRAWTAPLDFYDPSITPNTTAARVDDFHGPHAFYALTDGAVSSHRWAITQVDVSTQMQEFTHQFWDDRRTQADEAPYSFVW